MRQWRRGVSVVLACRDQFRIPCKRVGAACYTTDMEAIRNPVFRGRVVRRTFPATPDNGKNVTLATEADGRVLVVSFDTRAEVSRTKTDNFLIAMLKGRLGVSQLSLSLWAFSPLPTEERPLHRMAEVREPSCPRAGLRNSFGRPPPALSPRTPGGLPELRASPTPDFEAQHTLRVS
eukprot:Hpha_TRINITY_DN12446_c0_g2::TRINITY_DN12446_c0_g2_i1::g.42797::m.42797